MPNHPNRSSNAPTTASTPRPSEIAEFRRARNLTPQECGALVHVSAGKWLLWESGDRTMHPAFFELATLKAPQ